MKTHLEWYKMSHGNHNESEIRVIRSIYGLKGVAQWYILKNTIAGSDNCTIDTNIPSNLMSLQADLEMTPLEVQSFLKFLAETCNIIQFEDNKISSKELTFWLKKVLEKREKEAERINRKREEKKHNNEKTELTPTNEMLTPTNVMLEETNGKLETTINRVEKSIVEKSNFNNSSSHEEGSFNSLQNGAEKVVDGKAIKQLKKTHFDKILSTLCNKTGRKFRVINDAVKKKYKSRIKEGYTFDDILKAIENACQTKFHIDHNFQYCTPEFFSRSEKLDQYATQLPEKSTISKPNYDFL